MREFSKHAALALQVLASMIGKQCLATAMEQNFVTHVAVQVGTHEYEWMVLPHWVLLLLLLLSYRFFAAATAAAAATARRLMLPPTWCQCACAHNYTLLCERFVGWPGVVVVVCRRPKVFRALSGFTSSPAALAAMDSEFLVQFVDFVLVFLRNHYQRICVASVGGTGAGAGASSTLGSSNSNAGAGAAAAGGVGGTSAAFPIASFFALLLKLTCSPGLDVEVFDVCLEVWKFLLEEYVDVASTAADDDAQLPPPLLTTSLPGFFTFAFGGGDSIGGADAAAAAASATPASARGAMQPLLLEAFKQLAPQLLRRLFFQFNAAQLETLDDTPAPAGGAGGGDDTSLSSSSQSVLLPGTSDCSSGDAAGARAAVWVEDDLFAARSELDVFTARLARLVGKFAQLSELGTLLLVHIAPQLEVALGHFRARAALGEADVARVLHDVAASLALLCAVSGHFVHRFSRVFATAAAVFGALLELAKFCTAQRIYSQGIGCVYSLLFLRICSQGIGCVLCVVSAGIQPRHWVRL